ncbi:MAG: VOC family protein [Burkholderiales bacterium]|nr:VOC family protein [Burkholderiales bacterium]
MQLLVNIDVDDLERAIGFYRDAFGLHLTRRLFGGTVAEMAGAGTAICLISKPAGSTAAPGAEAIRDYRRHWTPVHLDFVVTDVTAAAAQALTAGAAPESPVESFAWGRQARFSDPFGHGFCLLQFSTAGYDAA